MKSIVMCVACVAIGCGTSPATNDGGTNDAAFDSTSPDASSPDADAGAITGAPDDQWTWVDFSTALCANGSPTGIAINPHAGATSLMIYFEGGGNCTSAATC